MLLVASFYQWIKIPIGVKNAEIFAGSQLVGRDWQGSALDIFHIDIKVAVSLDRIHVIPGIRAVFRKPYSQFFKRLDSPQLVVYILDWN